jgi:hypothetical protein
MAIKYTIIFHSKALQNLSKLYFWFENKPSGNPAFFVAVAIASTKMQRLLDSNWRLSDFRNK